MSIRVRCPCGKEVDLPDKAVGKRVECTTCRTVLSVAAPPPALPLAQPAAPRPKPVVVVDEPAPRPRRLVEADRDFEPSRKRAKTRKRPTPGSNRNLLLIFGAVGAVLAFLAVAAAVYFVGFAGSSSDDALVGNWETDPEAYKNLGANNMFAMMPLVKLTFAKDHTFRIDFLIEYDGRWKVVSRTGDTVRVKLTAKVIGFDQDNPPTVTIRVRDKDHLDFDSDEPSLQMHVKFRRVGTGPPMGPTLAQAEKAAGLDAGVQPDCEVLWHGQWFAAKVLKTEKDRWFIHYIGYPANWDEWVGADRYRPKK